MNIRVLYTGRSYQIGAQLPAELELPDGAEISAAIAALNAILPDDQPLPASCIVAVSGQHLGTVEQFEDRELREGEELVLVAPVAGG